MLNMSHRSVGLGLFSGLSSLVGTDVKDKDLRARGHADTAPAPRHPICVDAVYLTRNVRFLSAHMLSVLSIALTRADGESWPQCVPERGRTLCLRTARVKSWQGPKL